MGSIVFPARSGMDSARPGEVVRRTASAAKDLFCDHYCLMWATFDLLAIRVAAAYNNEQYRPCSIGALIMLTIYGMLT